MKRKSVMALLLIAAMLVMTVVLASCEKDEDDGVPSNAQSENGATHQTGDGVDIPSIPPGAVRERQDEGSQTFQIDPNDPNSDSFSHSFSVDESVGNHSFRSCLKITSTN